MPFHRKTANPAGYAPFPGGYDFINDPPANGDAGVAAPVSTGKKVGGPNEGTYLYAFGEDALSQHFNRAADALAENCDTLDEYARKPVPRVRETSLQTAVGAVGTIDISTLTGITSGIWLRDTTDLTETLNDLFVVVNANDEDIYNGTSKVVVTGFTSTDGGDSLGVGFSAGAITVNVSPSIPSGTQYRVYFHSKSNTAEGPTNISIRKQARGIARHNRDIVDNFPILRTPPAVTLISPVGAVMYNDPTLWANMSPLTGDFQQIDNLGRIFFLLDLPVGTIIDDVVVYFQKDSGSSWPPATFPQVNLMYHDIAAGFPSIGVTLIDVAPGGVYTPGSQVAYESYAGFTHPIGGHTVAAGRNYYLLVTGDGYGGAYGVRRLHVMRPMLNVTVPTVRRF